MNNKLSKFIGDKKFYKMVMIIAIPLMMQQLITSSVNLVDNLMVGQLGDAALGGVAAVNRYYLIATFGTNGLLAAASIFIAQYLGAKNEKKVKESFRISIIIAMLIMIVFFIIGYLFPNVIVGFFTKDALIIQQGVDYLKFSCFTFLPMIFSLSISSAYRACGQTKIPLFVSIIAVIINTFLNYVLIFGNFGFKPMGVEGAAIATLIARIIEALILLASMRLLQPIFVTKITKMFCFSKDLAIKILKKGAPLACNEVFWSIGNAMLFKFYATRGSEVMSGYAISMTTADIFFVLFGGMSVAAHVLISQKLGANKLDEARSNGYKLIGFSTMMSLAFSILMFSSSFFIPSLYNVSEYAGYVAKSVTQVQSLMFGIYMFTTMCYFIVRAGGDTKSTLYMDSVYMWVINLPIVAFLAYTTNISIIYLYVAGQLTDIVKMILSYKLVRKEKWVINLTHQDKID